MEAALRNRLTFGSLMLAGVFLLFGLDWLIELWTAGWVYNRELGRSFGVGGVGILILLLIILPLATREMATLLAAEKVGPYPLISAIGSGLLLVHAFLTQFDKFRRISTSALAFIIVFVMLFAALRRAWMRQSQEAIHHIAGTVLATLYLGGLGWFVIALRVKHGHLFSGSTAVILMIVLVVKSTDIGAYFGGRALGRHKLITWLSPGKTWEGLIIGVMTSGLVAMALVKRLPSLQYLPLWKGLIFGVVIGGIGQMGDLLESLLKRDAEVKDSGTLIPGFGGILDVVDSPLFAAPFAYLLFSLF